MEIEENIGYTFKDKSFLEEALTHRSYANEHNIRSNEKLEFLGDSILEFVSSEYLFTHYKNLNEGELTKTRAAVVCEESLYKVALKHNISNYIKVGKSELASNGNNKPAILADSIEAIIAAIFFDGGLEPAKKFIIDNLKDEMEIASKNVGQKDYKTVLQEELQKNGSVDIEYRIIDEFGPDNIKTFNAEVLLNGVKLAEGTGNSKKHAEMQAAKKALENMKAKKNKTN